MTQFGVICYTEEDDWKCPTFTKNFDILAGLLSPLDPSIHPLGHTSNHCSTPGCQFFTQQWCSYVNHLSCLLLVDKKAGFLKELWPRMFGIKNKWKLYLTPQPCLPPGIVSRQDPEQAYGSQSRHANHPVPHKGHHRNSASLGRRRIVQRGDHPRASLLPLLRSGRYRGACSTSTPRWKGWRRGPGTSGGGRCHGLRWPDGQGQRDHGGGQRTWGMLGLGCWAPCSFWCSGCSLYRLAEGDPCTTPQTWEASTWAPDITEAPGRSWNPARVSLTCTS